MTGASSLERALEEVRSGGFSRRLGIEVTRSVEGEASVSLPYRDINTNRSGNLHGGAHASTALAAAKLATASTQRSTDETSIVVRSLALSYLAPARNQSLSAHARVSARGRDVAHCDVRVESGEGVTVACGQIVLVIAAGESGEADGGPHRSRCASVYGRVDVDVATAVQGSAFLEASGLLRIDKDVDGWQSLFLPLAHNEGARDGIADGAVAALVDNCGSMAAYTAENVDREMLGATLSMNVAFGGDVGGSLVGSGRLIARAGSTLTSAVEIWSPIDGRVRADGLICYRVRGAG